MFGNTAQAKPDPNQAPEIVRANEMAQQFANQYFQDFSTGASNCAKFYSDASTLSFEGANCKGQQAIAQKLQEIQGQLPANSKPKLTTFDGQPSIAIDGGFVVYVTGDFMNQKMQEVFHLIPANGSFYVHNDIFRIGTNNQFNCDPNEGGNVTKAFVEHYVNLFDKNRPGLADLFNAKSVLTMEGKVFVGKEDILKRLSELPQVTHNLPSFTVDSQAVNGEAIILVNMSGELAIEGSSNALKFTQMFQLVKDGAAYFIGNMIYRLNYG